MLVTFIQLFVYVVFFVAFKSNYVNVLMSVCVCVNRMGARSLLYSTFLLLSFQKPGISKIELLEFIISVTKNKPTNEL